MAELRSDQAGWYWAGLTSPDQWCDRCLHNAGAYIIPFKITADGVTRYPRYFRCFNCGDWRTT